MTDVFVQFLTAPPINVEVPPNPQIDVVIGGGGGGRGGTVTSVGLELPDIFDVTGSPVTSAGTLAGALVAQAQKTFFAGPASGANAVPTFRTLTGSDIPDVSSTYLTVATAAATYQPLATVLTTLSALANAVGWLHNDGTGVLSWLTPSGGGGGSVTSVSLSMPNIFTVTGSPVTTAGTLAAALVTQAQKTFFAGPASGADAVPTFRTITATDIPDLSGTYLTVATAAATYQPLATVLTTLSALANAVGWLHNDGTGVLSWLTPSGGGGGSVTSVSLSMPNIFTVTGSPVTTAGTLAAALVTQAQKTFFAGPASGADAVPTFRTITATDIPDLSGTYLTVTTAGTTYQPKAAILTSLSALANAVGWLHNDGSGVLAWSTPGGSGTIGGSSGATDTALIRASGTGGSTIQGSNVTLANSGTAFVFSGAGGITAGGTNQNIVFTPSGTGEVQITSAVTGTARLLEIFATGANYVQYNIGKDSTHYLTVEWDGVSNVGDISTYTLAYPLSLRGSTLLLCTGASATPRLTINGTGNVQFNAYTTAGFAKFDASGNITSSVVAGFTSGTLSGLTQLAIRDTSAAFDVTLAATSSPILTAGRTLTFNLANVSSTLTITGNATISGTTSGGANPSATIGLAAVNGSATTFLRSDGAPALSQAIVPTWTGLHTFSAGLAVTLTTDSTSTATGSIITAGGLGVAKSVWIGGSFNAIANATNPGSLPAGALHHFIPADGTQTIIASDASAITALNLIGRSCEGTLASPTATTANRIFVQLAARGFANGAYSAGNAATVQITAVNNWSSTDNSTQVVVTLTPTGSIVPANAFVLTNSLLTISGAFKTNDTTDTTSTTTGSITTAGGLGVAKSLWVGGTVTTGAPAGGTAQPWKFGNVAVVTPTAPNRTVELEVNGTTYYLAAKTTNN